MSNNIAMGGHDITGATNITATTFHGALSGNVTGNVTGNADTATKLAGGGNTINGVSFDGSIPITITVPADAGTLTGDTLAAGVTASSLQSVGVLNGLTMSNNITMGSHDITGAINITATTFHGALSGNATTATTLATGNTINGVTFTGASPIVITAAAGTLTGDTLATNIVHSSLTGVGTLTALNMGGNIAMGTHDITGTGTIGTTILNASGVINANGGISTATGDLNLNSGSGVVNFNNHGDVILSNGGNVHFNGDIYVDSGLITTSGADLWLQSGGGNSSVQFAVFGDVFFNLSNIHSIGSLEVDNFHTPTLTVDYAGNLALSGTLEVGGTAQGDEGSLITNPTFTVNWTGDTMVGGTLYADGGINTDTGNLSLSSSGGNVVPNGTQNLGSSGSQWQNLYVSGTASVGSLSIGGGTTITKHLSAATTWDPASISNNTSTSTTVSVTGAHIGDTVSVGFNQAVPADALLVGSVTATGTVTVTLFNNTGGALNLDPGTLRADVWQH
jgi:hypothetical protein